jgi:hypothetical protein
MGKIMKLNKLYEEVKEEKTKGNTYGSKKEYDFS